MKLKTTRTTKAIIQNKLNNLFGQPNSQFSDKYLIQRIISRPPKFNSKLNLTVKMINEPECKKRESKLQFVILKNFAFFFLKKKQKTTLCLI